MCMFCAAVPTTLALGAAGQAKQTRAWKLGGEPTPVRKLPVSAVSLAIAFGLAMMAALYHSRWPSG